MTIYLHYQPLRGSSVGITHNHVGEGPIVVIAVMSKETSPPHLVVCDAAVNVLRHLQLARCQTNIAEASYHSLKHHRE